MDNCIPISLAVEDVLSESILFKLLKNYFSNKNFHICGTYGLRGISYLKTNRKRFNNAAKGSPYILLVDLDSLSCAPLLIIQWYPNGYHHNLLFRIAVREVESWLLAHREAFASYFGVSLNLLPHNPDNIDHPKEKLLEIVSNSRNSTLKRAILPVPGSTAKTGPDYNGTLSAFAFEYWNPDEARLVSSSLNGALVALDNFEPQYTNH